MITQKDYDNFIQKHFVLNNTFLLNSYKSMLIEIINDIKENQFDYRHFLKIKEYIDFDKSIATDIRFEFEYRVDLYRLFNQKSLMYNTIETFFEAFKNDTHEIDESNLFLLFYNISISYQRSDICEYILKKLYNDKLYQLFDSIDKKKIITLYHTIDKFNDQDLKKKVIFQIFKCLSRSVNLEDILEIIPDINWHDMLKEHFKRNRTPLDLIKWLESGISYSLSHPLFDINRFCSDIIRIFSDNDKLLTNQKKDGIYYFLQKNLKIIDMLEKPVLDKLISLFKKGIENETRSFKNEVSQLLDILQGEYKENGLDNIPFGKLKLNYLYPFQLLINPNMLRTSNLSREQLFSILPQIYKYLADGELPLSLFKKTDNYSFIQDEMNPKFEIAYTVYEIFAKSEPYASYGDKYINHYRLDKIKKLEAVLKIDLLDKYIIEIEKDPQLVFSNFILTNIPNVSSTVDSLKLLGISMDYSLKYWIDVMNMAIIDGESLSLTDIEWN